MVSAAYKNRTREEIIAAFRESIRKKHEWQERAEEEIKKIRQERLQLSIWPVWTHLTCRKSTYMAALGFRISLVATPFPFLPFGT